MLGSALDVKVVVDGWGCGAVRRLLIDLKIPGIVELRPPARQSREVWLHARPARLDGALGHWVGDVLRANLNTAAPTSVSQLTMAPLASTCCHR